MTLCIFVLACLLQHTGHNNVMVVEGIVKTPVYAIGGETTGTVLEGKTDYELECNAELYKVVKKLNNKKVVVTGKLRTVEGVEKKNRKIIRVMSIKEK